MEEDNQETLLEDSRRVIKEQAYFMRKALEEFNLRDGLKHSANMLNELRTIALSSKNYFTIFMQVFDELKTLEMHFREEYRRGRKLSAVYESVQHANNVVPRIYLLITVGSVYIASKDVPAKSILNDLSEMIKGVQHPTKGLFIRYYLLKMCKDKLPDRDSQYEGEGGSLEDAMNFILNNLEEMNKLWVKMQSGGSKDKVKREKERHDLKVTIAENFVRLSSLNGCTLEVYTDFIFKRIIQIITSTKDAMSQQHLMDCVIQAFPDDFHLETLETLLQTCGTIMQNGVDVKLIFIRLMDRLSQFAAGGDRSLQQAANQIDIFSMFKTNIDKIISEQGFTADLTKMMELQVAFLQFVGECYPAKIEYVNQIMESCCVLLRRRNPTEVDEDVQKNIVKVLTIPLARLSLSVIYMTEFPNLMKYLPVKKRKTVAIELSQSVANASRVFKSTETVKLLIYFLQPLVQESSEITLTVGTDYEAELRHVARLVHLAVHYDPNYYFEMLEMFREQFYGGGESRIRYTIPALVFGYIKLARYIKHCHEYHKQSGEKDGQENIPEDEEPPKFHNRKIRFFKGKINITNSKIFQITKQAVEKIASVAPEIALRLNLEIVQSISEVDEHKELDEFAYELCSNTLLLYQDQITNNDVKIDVLNVMIGAFQRLRCLGEDNYDTLAINTIQYSAKLNNKQAQCLATLQCSHFYYSDTMVVPNKVMDCFKKVLKLAETVVNAQPDAKAFRIYLMLLNKFLYFLEADNFNAVTSIKLSGQDVQTCVKLVKDKLPMLKNKADTEYVNQYLKNTLNFINENKASNPKFEGV